MGTHFLALEIGRMTMEGKADPAVRDAVKYVIDRVLEGGVLDTFKEFIAKEPERRKVLVTWVCPECEQEVIVGFDRAAIVRGESLEVSVPVMNVLKHECK